MMLLSQVSVPIDFPSNLKGDVPFHQAAFDYHRAEWNGLGDNLRDFQWEVFFKFGASAVASKFLEWAQVDIKPHSSTWFSTVRAVTELYGNHFLRLYQQNTSSVTTTKFRQARNRCKRALLQRFRVLRNYTLDDSGIPLPPFPSRTYLKLIYIPVTPRLTKKVITDFDLSKAPSPDCIPVVLN